jgi:hypothetical protein
MPKNTATRSMNLGAFSECLFPSDFWKAGGLEEYFTLRRRRLYFLISRKLTELIDKEADKIIWR